MITNPIETPEQIVAEIKAMFGRPALFSTEDETAYYKLMMALAASVRPRDGFGLMQLNDMTYSEWRKNWFRGQQSLTLERGAKEYRQATARRTDLESDKKQQQVQNDTDQEALKDLPAAEQRLFQLESQMEEADVIAAMNNAVAEVNYNRSLRANINFYRALDQFISIETDRRNESAQWMHSYWDFGPKPTASTAKQIDGEVVTQTGQSEEVPAVEAPLVPEQEPQ